MHKAVFVLLCLAGLSRTALAQPDSPADLRQEIATLRERNDALRAEVESLRQRLKTMLAEVERLQRALAAAGNPGQPAPAVPPARAITSTDLQLDRLATPQALFVALTVQYAQDILSAAPAGTDDWLPDPTRVRDWAEEAGASMAGQATWLTRLRLVTMEDDADARRAMVTVLDPRTLAEISEPFAIDVPDRLVAHIEHEVKAAEVSAVAPPLWSLRVALRPDIIVDDARDTPGAFNYPPWIGPFAAFDFTVDVLGAGPIAEDQARQPPPPADGPPVDR